MHRFRFGLLGIWLPGCCAALGFGFIPPGVQAQADECNRQPTAQGCAVPRIANGTPVPSDVQRQLGLVTVNGGCSGTLVNRYWLLTARHCVTRGNTISGVLLPPQSVSIKATWAPGRTVRPLRIQELAVNQGVTSKRDIILIYLGAGDLGPVNQHRPYMTISLFFPNLWIGRRLETSDTVNQYGQGFSTFASGTFGTPSAVPATGLGTYRTASFLPSNITETHYDLAMNSSNQVGHGGDSGGPTYITRNGISFIAGVQSTCTPTRYIPGTPMPADWQWAEGIAFCSYVSVEPLVEDIHRIILENPECKLGPACAMPAVLEYLLP